MSENPRRGREARNFTTNVPKILDLKSSSEQIFSENCRWVPLKCEQIWIDGIGQLKNFKPCLLKPKNGQNNMFESTGLFTILFISDTCWVNITLDKACTTLRSIKKTNKIILHCRLESSPGYFCFLRQGGFYPVIEVNCTVFVYFSRSNLWATYPKLFDSFFFSYHCSWIPVVSTRSQSLTGFKFNKWKNEKG